MNKLIITAAVTGSVHTPTMSEYLPITPHEISDEAVKACESGAAVVHIHARNPETGQPTHDLEVFREIATRIKKQSDVVVCISTGAGGATGFKDIVERTRSVTELKPEMASLNMGSINFGAYPLLRKFERFKYPWEKQHLERSRDYVFRNTFKELEYVCKTMRKNQTRPELECYDVGHLYNIAQLIRDGFLDFPIHVQFVMGILGGIGSSIEDLMHMKHTADRLFGDGYMWSTMSAGKMEFPLCTLSAIMGGHIRVGLEDNLYLRRGVLAKSNAELVEKMVRIVDDVTGGLREIAAPADARKILGLKGREKVNF